MVQPAPLIMKEPSANFVQRIVNASGDADTAVVVVATSATAAVLERRGV